jgi:predicted XRE-type DNA-binding protein
MANRIRSSSEARRRWDRLARQIGDQLRAARRAIGASQAQVAAAIGVSQSEVSRRERAHLRGVFGEALSIHAAAVGLKLAVNLWPIGGAIRDAAQVRYVGAFVARVGRAWRVTLEAPMAIAGDLRAVDVLLAAGQIRIAVEVITQLTDVQAQVRAAQLKARDLGATRLVIVLAGTHANRSALAAASTSLASSFDLDTRRVMRALAAGRDPGRDGIVVIDA